MVILIIFFSIWCKGNFNCELWIIINFHSFKLEVSFSHDHFYTYRKAFDIPLKREICTFLLYYSPSVHLHKNKWYFFEREWNQSASTRNTTYYKVYKFPNQKWKNGIDRWVVKPLHMVVLILKSNLILETIQKNKAVILLNGIHVGEPDTQVCSCLEDLFWKNSAPIKHLRLHSNENVQRHRTTFLSRSSNN
jgi:hypothetical protein